MVLVLKYVVVGFICKIILNNQATLSSMAAGARVRDPVIYYYSEILSGSSGAAVGVLSPSLLDMFECFACLYIRDRLRGRVHTEHGQALHGLMPMVMANEERKGR